MLVPQGGSRTALNVCLRRRKLKMLIVSAFRQRQMFEVRRRRMPQPLHTISKLPQFVTHAFQSHIPNP
jgi:hypothetical protein